MHRVVATVLAVAGVLPGEHAPAGPGSASPASVEQLRIGFADHLGLGDLELRGPRASARVSFRADPGCKPVAGSRLRLVLQHSATLEERSYLSVWLNHGVLRSLRLAFPGGRRTEVEIDLPAASLREDNQLVFSAEEAATQEPEAWARILAGSSITLSCERKPVTWSLRDLPEPILSRRTVGPKRLTVLQPANPSPETVEAMARAVANLSRRVAPAPVVLSFVGELREATSAVLVVGTPQEQPGLRQLVLPAPLRLTAEGLGTNTSLVDASTGVVAVTTASSIPHPLLLLTGNTPKAVARAEGAVWGPALEKSAVRFASGPAVEARRQPRHWTGYAPPWNPFSLGDIGDEEAELAVTAETSARVHVRATPDAVYFPYGHALKLAFRALPAVAEDPDGVLEVYWNDLLLKRESVRTLTRGTEFSLGLRLPRTALGLDNELRVTWNGRSGASGPFVVLRPESELYLPRDFITRVPDLALLHSSFYPLSREADLADTVLLLPPEAGAEGRAALCELSALLGRLLPTERIRFRVAEASSLRSFTAQSNVLLLETAKSPSLSDLPSTDPRPLPRGAVLARLPLLEVHLSPWNADRHVLRLRATSVNMLRAAVRSLALPEFLGQLRGDTAFLAAEGPTCMALRPQRTVAEVSHLARLEAWLRDNWLALPAILALVSGLLFMGLRLTLEHRRDARRVGRVEG